MALSQRVQVMLSHPYARLRRTLGNVSLATRLYVLTAVVIATWTLLVLLLVAGERGLQREFGQERRVIADLVESSVAIESNLARLQLTMAARHNLSADALEARQREVSDDLESIQRHILEDNEGRAPTASLVKIRDRISALREATEQRFALERSWQNIAERFQSIFDASIAAREDASVAEPLSPAKRRAERELDASFDALMMVATTHSGADDVSGIKAWIALLEKRARHYEKARENATALESPPDSQKRLYQMYGDREQLRDLVAQLLRIAHAEIAAAGSYELTYEAVRNSLFDGDIGTRLTAKERGELDALDMRSAATHRTLLFTIGIGMALVAAGTIAVIRRMTRPLVVLSKDTQTALGRYGKDDSGPARERNEVEGIATAFRQMTDRLDDVTLSVDYLGDIISSLSIGLLVTDASEQIRMANPAFRKMAGFPADGGSLIGKRLTVFFEKEAVAMTRQPGVRSTGKTGTETTLRTQSGDSVPVILVSTALPESGAITGSVYAAINVSERKLAEDRVLAGRDRIESLVQHLHEIQEMERNRIARDLHDDLGAVLTALRNGLVRLSGVVGGSAGEAANDLVLLADKANTTVDRVLKNLWPQMLDHFGLGGALEALAAEFEHTHGVDTKCGVDIGQTRFNRRVELALYRASQEALTNVAKHAHARSVQISLVNRGMETVLEINDDGHGFVRRDERARDGGYGLLGMRQRIAAVGGTLAIETGVKGSKITIRLPLTSATSGVSARTSPENLDLPDDAKGKTDDQSSAG